jgi:hypothetical protein
LPYKACIFCHQSNAWEHILVIFETSQELVEHALEFLRIGLLEKEEDVMLITNDAMSIDRIHNKISSEWNVELMSLERKVVE